MIEQVFPTFMSWTRRRGSTWRTAPWWFADTRHAQQRSLLRLLSVAHRERLEIPPLVENLAAEHRGSYRRALRRLAKRLASGTSLLTALEQTPDVLSDSMVLALRFGSQSGTLPATYAQLLEAQKFDAEPRQTSARHLLFYWIAPSLILLSVVCFLMAVIVPTFKKIAEEFGVLGLRGPAFGNLLTSFDFISYYAGSLFLAAVVLGWLVLAGPPRRFFRRVLAGRFIHTVAQLRSIELLRLFAAALDAGRPLPGALSTLARYHFDSRVRQRLLYARNEVEQGVDVWTSLTDAKLLTASESDALAKSTSNAARSWTLRHLADWKLAKLNRRVVIFLTFLHPIIVLIFGAIVLAIVYGLFSFLTYFISSFT